MYLPRIPSKSAFFLLLLNSTLVQANSLQIMDDAQLSNVTGQSLLTLSYISPNDSNNLEAKRLNGNQNIGFYKLGMEADIDLNANIRRLQLGCGGVNGIGCDIDIDYLSLSGVAETSTERASSSAKITNPFIEFAIRNPNTSSTREVVGLRLSAEKVLGLLTLGTQNSAQANGINSFSGYMKVQSGMALLHKDLKCKAPLIEPNLRRNLGKWST